MSKATDGPGPEDSQSLVVSQASRTILSNLMDVETIEDQAWSSGDLASLLDHQLQTPVFADQAVLAEHAPSPEQAAREIAAEGDRTYLDVLRQGTADSEVLRLIKAYARDSLVHGGGLPREVARVVYVASLLRARALGVTDFTTLDDTSVVAEARRCLTYPWLSEAVRNLFRRGLED